MHVLDAAPRACLGRKAEERAEERARARACARERECASKAWSHFATRGSARIARGTCAACVRVYVDECTSLCCARVGRGARYLVRWLMYPSAVSCRSCRWGWPGVLSADSQAERKVRGERDQAGHGRCLGTRPPSAHVRPVVLQKALNRCLVRGFGGVVMQTKKDDKVTNNLNPYIVGFILFVVIGSGTCARGTPRQSGVRDRQSCSRAVGFSHAHSRLPNHPVDRKPATVTRRAPSLSPNVFPERTTTRERWANKPKRTI